MRETRDHFGRGDGRDVGLNKKRRGKSLQFMGGKKLKIEKGTGDL